MENLYSLNGKIALITGGGTGIGLGIAQEFLKQGARVVITGRREQVLKDAQAALGKNCFYRVHDVTEKETHAALIESITSETGPIDILVNNAGRHCKKPSLECDNAEFETVLNTNLSTVFSLTNACLPSMIERRSGSVINISSMAALYGIPLVSAYSCSKTALIGLARSLSAEYSQYGVRFNCIMPGFIESEMFRKAMEADPAREARILQRTPMRRTGTPEEIGYAAAFLASDASKFITGISLPVDGGNSIGF